MTYVDEAKAILGQELPGLVDDHLLDLYVLLVLTRGEATTREHVHDAWSIWRLREDPEHRSVVPFGDLSPDIQELDQPYVDAVRETARRIGAQKELS